MIPDCIHCGGSGYDPHHDRPCRCAEPDHTAHPNYQPGYAHEPVLTDDQRAELESKIAGILARAGVVAARADARTIVRRWCRSKAHQRSARLIPPDVAGLICDALDNAERGTF